MLQWHLRTNIIFCISPPCANNFTNCCETQKNKKQVYIITNFVTIILFNVPVVRKCPKITITFGKRKNEKTHQAMFTFAMSPAVVYEWAVRENKWLIATHFVTHNRTPFNGVHQSSHGFFIHNIRLKAIQYESKMYQWVYNIRLKMAKLHLDYPYDPLNV